MSPADIPEREPTMEPDPSDEFMPDPAEPSGDPLDPIPLDGRGSQPAEGSSDNAATMGMDDPLREPGYIEAEELPYVEDEVNELEDDGSLEDPAADRLANRSIEEEEAAEARGEEGLGRGDGDFL